MTFGEKHFEPKESRSSAPGPGNYNVSDRFNGKSIKFGTELRDPKNTYRLCVIPGPGSYKIQNSIGTATKTKFGKCKREGMLNKSCAPGPKKYEAKLMTGHEGYA